MLLGFVGLIHVGVLFGLPWYMALLGAVEHVFAISFHLSASLMVMQAVGRGKIKWLLAAVGWHTLLNGVALFTAVSYTLHPPHRPLQPTHDPTEPKPEPLPDLEPLQLKKKPITAENLENSRYS